MREPADNRRNGMNGTPSHLRAQLVAESFDDKPAIKKLRLRHGQRKQAFLSRKVRRGEDEQMRCVVLQVAAVHQKLAQRARTFG